MFIMPIFTRARAIPMVRTNIPPMAVWAANTCSTRARILARRWLACVARSDNFRVAVPLVWMWLR